MSQVNDERNTSAERRDPILSAINLHGKAHKRFEQVLREEDARDRCSGPPSAEFEEAESADTASAVLVLNTVPTTFQGVLKLLDYLANAEQAGDSLFGMRLHDGAVTEPGQAFRLISDALQMLDPDALRRYADEKEEGPFTSADIKVLAPAIADAMKRVNDLVAR